MPEAAPAKDGAVEQLQKQIDNIMQELNLLKEQQALQTGEFPSLTKDSIQTFFQPSTAAQHLNFCSDPTRKNQPVKSKNKQMKCEHFNLCCLVCMTTKLNTDVLHQIKWAVHVFFYKPHGRHLEIHKQTIPKSKNKTAKSVSTEIKKT